MLKFLGSLLVLGVAVIISITYREYRARSLEELSACRDMLEGLHRSLVCYGLSIRRWAEGYSIPLFEENGLLPGLRNGDSPSRVITELAMSGRLSLECRDIMLEAFRDFGQGYIEEQITRIDQARGELEKIEVKEKEGAKRAVRAVTAISMGVGCGAVLLLL